MPLKKLSARREFLHMRGDPPTWPHAGTAAETLADAATLVAGVRSRTVAVHLPAVQEWKQLGGPFEKQLEKHRLRGVVPWLPREPAWHRAGRRALSWGWVAVLVFLTLLGTGAEVMRGEDDQSFGNLLFGGLVTAGVIGVLIAVGFGIGWLRRGRRAKHAPPDPGDGSGSV